MKVMIYIIKYITFCYLFVTPLFTYSQHQKNDSLRGSITKARAWWDVKKYNLNLKVNPDKKHIEGYNAITYQVLKPNRTLQFELQTPLKIDSITQDGSSLLYHSNANSYYVFLKKEQKTNSKETLIVHYHGHPKTAALPPWEGGFVWSKDHDENHFIATANQSIGASVWWPCKDHPADEPESFKITLTTPSYLTGVSNGRLTETVKHKNGTTSYSWEVKNPINHYGVSVNIAKYINYKEKYKGLKGNLDCDYYILPYNQPFAKLQFKDVPKSLEAFEYWFGPYPFYKDSYKLVDVPYLGMEHQSCVAYGNQYKKGYLGKGMGDSKWGMKFDYIIVHETGHEWFANSITCNDVADLWIHEAFTTYAESLFLEYHYGKKIAYEYLIGFKSYIKNNEPIVGEYGVRDHGGSDKYFKGALMLHTLRQFIENDDLWRQILLGINHKFYHQTVSGKQIIDYINSKTPYLELEPFFKQYLNTSPLPELSIQQKGGFIYYKWTNVVPDFSMPVKVYLMGEMIWIKPSDHVWKKLKGNKQNLRIDDNFLINLKLHKDSFFY